MVVQEVRSKGFEFDPKASTVWKAYAVAQSSARLIAETPELAGMMANETPMGQRI